MSIERGDDLERDAHLRASLRHAPDAGLGPSQALSDAILAEARAKARTPHTAAAPRRNPLQALWQALGRPAVGTALAGVMVATVVGVIWREGPPEENVPVVASAPAPAPAPVQERVEPAPVPTAPRAETREQKKKEPKASPPPAAKPRAPAPVAAAPAPVPEPAPPQQAPANDSAVARAEAEVAPRVAQSRAKAEAGFLASDSREHRQAFASGTPDFSLLRAALVDEPARWTWRRNGEAALATDDALRDWLAELDTATRGTWRRILGFTAPPSVSVLQLMRDGRVRLTLLLQDGQVIWLGEDGGAWQTDLPITLREGLAR